MKGEKKAMAFLAPGLAGSPMKHFSLNF